MLISCSETVGIQNFQGPVTCSMFLVTITKPHTFIFCNIFLMVLTFCFLRLQISVFLRVAGTQVEKSLFHTILKEKALKGLHAPTVCALLLLCIASRKALKKLLKSPQPCLFWSHPLTMWGVKGHQKNVHSVTVDNHNNSSTI